MTDRTSAEGLRDLLTNRQMPDSATLTVTLGELRAAFRSDSDSGIDALAEAVSDSLAATTEGTDDVEAPAPSDEPGSPYVLRLTNELAARSVVRLSTPRTETPDR